MHRRILFGVAAWLLGAATATAGSLLAVSLLGQGITGATGPLLSQVAVNRALASEAAEPAAGAAPSAGHTGAGATASPGATRAAASGSAVPSSGAPSSGASPSGAPSGTLAASAPAPSATVPPAAPSAGVTSDGGASGGGTVLASRGGDVVASCQARGAYLDSWSPAQGFVAGDVRRGPAQVARVTFDPASASDDSAVTMLVSCSAGIPSATTKGWGTGDE